MNTKQLRAAIDLDNTAKSLLVQLETFTLLQLTDRETSPCIHVGVPNGTNHSRITVSLPSKMRWYAFRLWKRDTAMRYNEAVRGLNQLGVQHEYELMRVPEAHEPVEDANGKGEG